MKRTLSLVLVALMLTSCFLFTSCGKKDNGLAVCLASEPATIDPALNSAVDGATLIIHAFSGLIGWRKNASGALELYADCAKAIPTGTKAADGKMTYVFELKDDLKWSDGSALTAADFVYAWNRAVKPATAADYGYMFDVIDGYDKVTELDADGNAVNADAVLNVTASEDGKSLTVVTISEVPYFFELLAFPTYMPVKKDVVDGKEGWATDPATYIGNGPYILKEWNHSSNMIYEKNPNYHAADTVTMDKITFYLSDDSNNMLANYKNGDWLFIDDVPTNEIASLKTDYPNEFTIAGQLGTYYVIFNVNKSILPTDTTLAGAEAEKAEMEIRKALSLLLDRNYICESIAQGGQVAASSFVSMGLIDADGKSQFYKNTGFSTEFDGYFNTAKEAMDANIESAIVTLKKFYKYDDATKKFTDFPSGMVYLYNTSEGHKAIGEYIQGALDKYGISLTLQNEEWNSFLETRKKGDYTIARNGWVADYNDPISYLDMWTTVSGNNDAQFGKDAHKELAIYSIDLNAAGINYKKENATWAETYDYCIAEVKKSSDPATRFKLMHIAEDLLMSTGAIVPIYFYTDLYMCSPKIEGFFVSPLGYKFFMYTTITK